MYHSFEKLYYDAGKNTDYFSVDTLELKYSFTTYHGGPLNLDIWYYYLPGFGYSPTTFKDSDWTKYNHCESIQTSSFLE